MLCKKCNNMLDKKTVGDAVKFMCPYCGSEYGAAATDALIFAEDQRRFDVKKRGRTIWAYPANQKIALPCPECRYPIVAWENDYRQSRVYGCQCGHSWRDESRLPARADAKSVTPGDAKSDAKSSAKSDSKGDTKGDTKGAPAR